MRRPRLRSPIVGLLVVAVAAAGCTSAADNDSTRNDRGVVPQAGGARARRAARTRSRARRRARWWLPIVAILLVGCAASNPGDPSADSRLEGLDRRDDVELAADVYVGGYPLVVSTRTFEHFAGLIGVNHLVWQPTLSGPASRAVVAPNRDTLYSIAVLDLRSEPVALTLPEIADRYYTYQLLDAWTESFAYIGTRATGGRAGTWVITPPGWAGELPQGVRRIESTTNQLMLLGRYLVDGEPDIQQVKTLGEHIRLETLSDFTGAAPLPPPPPLGEPAGPAQAIPDDASFYAELGEALAVNGATTDHQRTLFERAERLGIGSTQPRRFATHRAILDEGAGAGAQRIQEAIDRQLDAGGWESRSLAGRYADDLLQRAVVARVGWGANVPEEAVYPIARADDDGEPLNGSHTYRLRFPADQLPPVAAFWSLTVYGTDLFFVEHPSGRYSIGDRTPGLIYGDDGSLEITISHAPPPAGSDPAPTNWLPSPEGPFVLMLRLYLPQLERLEGYTYPSIEPLS